MRFEERVIGCFKGLAIGDAIGKQTETLTRTDVRKWYSNGITGFEGRPGDVIPRYIGKRYEWRIGETTDDTEQTLAVARAILRERDIRHEVIGQELLRCKKSVHPGVALWSFLQAGDPARIASGGDGCGAAMRSAPLGVIYAPDRLHDLIRGAYECAIPTHGGPSAISGAAAVAGAVSAALEGRPRSEVLAVAVQAANGADALHSSEGQFTMARSMERVYRELAESKHLAAGSIAEHSLPNKSQNVVPLAIGLALVTQSAEKTALIAANTGGDADTVASIGCAIAGALCPETVNHAWFDVVSMINKDDLIDTATALAKLRFA